MRLGKLGTASLTSLPQGTDVFIDANIFIYAFGRQSRQCRDLLVRCAREEVFAITTLEVIHEVTHRLMLAEAYALGLIHRPNAQELGQQLSAIRGLSWYWRETL